MSAATNNPSWAKIEAVFNDASYREMIESTASFNSRIMSERKMRLPFYDSQTGIAQSSSNLWMLKRYRMPGLQHGQIYSYPRKRFVLFRLYVFYVFL